MQIDALTLVDLPVERMEGLGGGWNLKPLTPIHVLFWQIKKEDLMLGR